MSGDGDDGLYPDHDSPPGFDRTRSAYAAAALVATIVLLGVWVMWPDNNNTKTGDTAAPVVTNPVPPGPGGTNPGSPSGTEVEDPPGPAGECPERGSSDKIPPPMAGTITWDLYNGAAVPRSSTAGPLRVEDNGLARCYEQSPSGAVLMAMNFKARWVLSPEPAAIANAQMVESNVKADGVKKLAEMGGPIADPASFCQFAAYKVVSFSAEAASVDLVNQCGANDLRSGVLELRWVDDDWQVILEPNDGGKPLDRLATLNGYTPFRGVGG